MKNTPPVTNERYLHITDSSELGRIGARVASQQALVQQWPDSQEKVTALQRLEDEKEAIAIQSLSLFLKDINEKWEIGLKWEQCTECDRKGGECWKCGGEGWAWFNRET